MTEIKFHITDKSANAWRVVFAEYLNAHYPRRKRHDKDPEPTWNTEPLSKMVEIIAMAKVADILRASADAALESLEMVESD